jgi:hypothetical protein
VLIVRRALSGASEQTTKSRRIRYVPLAAQALAALRRVVERENFTGPTDYVFATLAGERPDPSALRRRYIGCRDAAKLPPLRFHDLRHTAGSLLVRVMDPISVKDIMDMRISRRPSATCMRSAPLDLWNKPRGRSRHLPQSRSRATRRSRAMRRAHSAKDRSAART